MAVVLEAKNLPKMCGDMTAVDHVSIAVEKGLLFRLHGPNGSGKTTMIKMMTDQTRPTSGSATVLGLDTGINRMSFARTCPAARGRN